MIKGILFGVGVGPGDPELLTVKAVRLLEECDVVAVPDSGTSEQTALAIAREYIADKPVLSLHLPMTRDSAELARYRETAAAEICRELDAGKNVVFLTLGDTTVYSTYSYLHRLVEARGYEARMIPGVPSFCAAAAALGVPLCEGGQPLHILPASYEDSEEALELDGVRVLMKSGKKTGELLTLLEDKGMLENAALVERVGMEGERLLPHPKPDMESGYFSIVIVRESLDRSHRRQAGEAGVPAGATVAINASAPRFPLFLSLEDKPVLIVGGGSIAARRAEILIGCGAKITVISPSLCPDFIGMKDRIHWREEDYADIDRDYALAVAATDDRQVNRQVGLDCAGRNIPVSVADRKDESTFWFPAIVKQGNLVAGLVSITGEDHRAVRKAAAKIRSSIKKDGIMQEGNDS